MNMRDLSSNGDWIERSTWPDLKHYFPHYEEFWCQHVFPLRESPESVRVRNGLDEAFERLAMAHYSTYVSLARAHEKIQDEKNLFFPDEVYWNLYRAGQVALEYVVPLFSTIYQECLKSRPNVNTIPLNSSLDRIRPYRNLIHGPIQAIGSDEASRPLIPRPGKVKDLKAYPKWSETFNAQLGGDFVDARKQLNDDLRSLSSGLETAWTDMCELSNKLATNADYLKRRAQGTIRYGLALSSVTSTVSTSATTVGVVIGRSSSPATLSSSS